MPKSHLFLRTFAILCVAQFQAMFSFAHATDAASELRQMSPSSRRSPLIISEIMYHPQDRTDDKNLEFIELCNTEPVDWDISGFSLSGEIEYSFPEGTILPARSFVVVAAEPESMESYYGLTDVLGPYSGRLNNGGGSLRLINRRGGVLVDLDYDDHTPWPESADGLGHSLVMTRPDYGHENPRTWQASSRRDGNPMGINEVVTSVWNGICINEVLAHTDGKTEAFIELYNQNTSAVDLSGCALSDDPDELKYVLPSGTEIPAGGYLALYASDWANAMNLNPWEDRIYLLNADQDRVIDAVTYEAQDAGISEGHWPDGTYGLRPLTEPTPGQANSVLLSPEIVINEIMYHPITEDSNDEYVELYNPGIETVDLSGWRLKSGIKYTLPNQTSIAAGDYLVIAANADHLISRYAQLNADNTLGDFEGALSNGGETLRLCRPITDSSADADWIVVDEVTYADDEAWGQWSDGGGSSLELIDPHSDNDRPGNWAASDETDKAPWTTFSVTGVLDEGSGTCDAYEVMLLDEGECILDNISITRSNSSTNRAENGDFENGTSGWDIEGNHVLSSVVQEEGVDQSQAMHLIATGDGDNLANCLRNDLSSRLNSGQTATLTAQGRWLCGHRNALLRLHGNYLEAVGTLDIPEDLGTPGQANSCRLTNTGPVVEETCHSPVLPQAQEDIVISTRVCDVDGIQAVTLHYRLDPKTSYNALAMNDEGLDGDTLAGDGIHSTQISGQASGTLIAFYIEAEDSDNALSQFPKVAEGHEALVRVGDFLASGVFGQYRMWITEANGDYWSDAPRMSNEIIDGTFVYGDFRVVYNAGIRMRGSGWIRARFDDPLRYDSAPSFVIKVPKSERVMGSRSFNIDNLQQDDVWGRGVLDPTFLRERMSYWIGEQLGVETCYQRFVILNLNGTRKGVVYTDTQHPNRDYMSSWFPEDDEGDSFELDTWFEYEHDFPSNVTNAKLESYTTTDGAKKQARYRWNWEKKVAHATDDDYSSLFSLVDTMNSDVNYVETVDASVDWDQWMRGFAVRRGAAADRDGYGYEAGKNAYVYKGKQSKWKYILWDLDLGFGIERDYDAGLFDEIGDPVLEDAFFQEPVFRRAYWRALQNLVDGPMKTEIFNPAVEAYYQAFQDNDIDTDNPQDVKTWVRQRGDFIREKLTSVEAAFAIPMFGGVEITLPLASFTFSGTAPVEVNTICLNGVPQTVTWTSVTNWQITIDFAPGENVLVFTALDSWGNELTGMTETVTITYTP